MLYFSSAGHTLLLHRRSAAARYHYHGLAIKLFPPYALLFLNVLRYLLNTIYRFRVLTLLPLFTVDERKDIW